VSIDRWCGVTAAVGLWVERSLVESSNSVLGIVIENKQIRICQSTAVTSSTRHAGSERELNGLAEGRRRGGLLNGPFA
jgi:hypothetical protein